MHPGFTASSFTADLVETRYRGMADTGIGNVVDTLPRRHSHHRCDRVRPARRHRHGVAVPPYRCGPRTPDSSRCGFSLKSWRLHLSCVGLGGSDSLVVVGGEQRRRAVPSCDVVEVPAPGENDSAGQGAGGNDAGTAPRVRGWRRTPPRRRYQGTTRPCPSIELPQAGNTVS